MKLEQLASFEAVARIGNFTRAADELFLAQPSLSRQIAALEADLGATLFDRGTAGAKLTAAGEALLPIASRMLADARTARERMDDLVGLRRGRVRLGAPPTLCVSLVADVLAGYRAEHPGVDLHITERGSRSLVEELDQGALDLALVVTRGAETPAAGVEVIPLLTEALVVVSAVDADLPEELTLADVARTPQVAFSRSYDLRVATDAAFAARGLEPLIAVEGAEMDAVLRFVERGLGVAVVPAMTVVGRPLLRSSRLVRPQLGRTVNLARRTRVEPSAAAAALETMLFDTVARLGKSSSELAQLVDVTL